MDDGHRVGILRHRCQVLKVEPRGPIELIESIRRGDLVGVPGAEPPGVEHAEVRVPAQVTAEPGHGGPGVLLERGRAGPLVGRKQEVGESVPRGEHADHVAGRATDLPGYFDAAIGIGDRPGQDCLNRSREELGAFEEERALFRIEQREASVDVEQGRVGLDLREVGVHGRVEGDVRGHSPMEIAAEFGGGIAGPEPSAGKRDAVIGPPTGQRGHHLDVASRGDPLESGDSIGLAQVAVVAPVPRRRRHPVSDVPRLRSHERHPPRLSLGGAREPERLERDRQLDFEAVGRQVSRRGPDRVPRVVLAPLGDASDPVGLYAEGVDAEDEGPPLIVERIDVGSQEIVEHQFADGVPFDHVRADLRRIRIRGSAAEEERFGVEGDMTDGAGRRRGVVPGRDLPGDRDGLGAFPAGIGELTIDDDGAGGPPHRIVRRRGGGGSGTWLPKQPPGQERETEQPQQQPGGGQNPSDVEMGNAHP